MNEKPSRMMVSSCICVLLDVVIFESWNEHRQIQLSYHQSSNCNCIPTCRKLIVTFNEATPISTCFWLGQNGRQLYKCNILRILFLSPIKSIELDTMFGWKGLEGQEGKQTKGIAFPMFGYDVGEGKGKQLDDSIFLPLLINHILPLMGRKLETHSFPLLISVSLSTFSLSLISLYRC